MAGGLKEVRNRIASVGSTRQITQAMKVVSAAKLRRAQEAVTQMRPYAEKLQEILVNVSGSMEASDNPYAIERETKNVLLVAITSNRGLCGPFNNNVIKMAKERIESHAASNVHVLCLGKKAGDVFRKTDHFTTLTLGDQPHEIFDRLDFANTSEVAQAVMDAFTGGGYDKVELIYNRFVNAAVQDIQCEQMLPIEQVATEGDAAPREVDYIFEPSQEEIAANIVPNTLKIQLYKALLDSHASEHGARMTAMHKATENAGEMLRELKLSYNKARQAAITAEILEIVGGAEALEG
ncbi:MAG: ATP synthase F1 subunit gamma [Flavobacteriales bacterium]|nr:ATP synthase F1 subunit gamma [Flavobacteriales bacterium]